MKQVHARGVVVAAVACSLAVAQLPAAAIADEPDAPDEASATRSLGSWRDARPSAGAVSIEWPDWTDDAYLSTLKDKAEAAGQELRAAGQEIVEAGRDYFEDLLSGTGGGEGPGDAGDPDAPAISDSAEGAEPDGSGPFPGAGTPSGGTSVTEGGEGSSGAADAPGVSGSSGSAETAGPTEAVPGDAGTTIAEDGRAVSVLVLNEGVSIAYGDERAMNEELTRALVASLTDAKTGEPIACSGRIALSYTRAVGIQDVTVTYVGDADHAPAEAVATVEVLPGTASIAVNSQSIAYGESVDAVVTADPGNAKPVTVIAGVDTSGQPFVGADFPDVTIGDLMGEEASVLDGATLQGLMVMLAGPDFSLGAIEGNLGTIGEMLAFAGVENAGELVEGLQAVIDVARDISPDLLDVSVKLGATPTEAGLYTVIAFTANKNYDTAFDVGYIAVKQRYEDIALEFAQQMDDGAHLTVDDAAAFDYGVAVRDVEGAPIDDAKVVASFDGIAYDGSLYHSSEAPCKPGAYFQTAYMLGGNYYASPIARSYVIERYDTALTIDGAVDGVVTVKYNGAPQRVGVTLTRGDGTVVEDAQVELAYYRGAAENGDRYISATPPTDAGTYRVTAAYAGDDRYEPAAACAELVIEKADAHIDVTGAYHTTYGDPVDHAAMAAEFTIDAHGAPIPDEALAVLRDYLVCPCGGDDPHAGIYTVELEDGFSIEEDSLFKRTVVDSGNFAVVEVEWECEHVVDPRPLTLRVDDAVKTAGDADPVFAYTLVDGEGTVLPDAAELLAELGDVDIAREEGERPGVYAITEATCENGDYALALYGTPVLTVEAQPAAPVSPEAPQAPALPSVPVRPGIPRTADALDGGVFAAEALAVAGAGAVLASLIAFARRLGR